ncbi:MAG: CPBP family intramembrane metalloprotease [Actinomycetia bacterium]|nr:CPBP family intramembrane metalloprotease [Actinomycetes bacterium]
MSENAEAQVNAGASSGLWERPHLVFLGIAYGFSWVLWIAAWLIGNTTDAGDLLFNENIIWRLVFVGDVSAVLFWSSLVALVAVYGPMLGGFVASRVDPAIPKGDLGKRIRKVNVGGREYGLVILILLAVTIPPLILTMLTAQLSNDGPSLGQLVPFLVMFFVLQFFTSGTEEIGWRGYLTQKLLPGRGFWDTGWAVGIVWAIWHLPVVIMIFLQQGMVHVQILGSLVGFGIGIVAMAILQAWFYERTRSVFLAMFIHAIFNTLPLTIVLLWEGSPAAVLANVLLWVVVIYIKSSTDKAAKLVSG